MRVLLVGWSSVLHGESTAGDVLSTAAVADHLRSQGHTVDEAWSPAMFLVHGSCGGRRYDDVDPGNYDTVVWVCGPLAGEPVREFHARFADVRRIAVGVSVLDADDPAVTGFDVVVARDAPGVPGRRDLAARPVAGAVERTVEVVGVFLTHGQGEYGARRRHEAVGGVLGNWLGGLDVARLELDTRLDPRDWRSPATPDQVLAVVSRLDVVVTTRLHGLVLALRCGVPALALDPVAGGGKVSAQAAAWGWPGLVGADELLERGPVVLDEQFAWCRSGAGRAAAHRARAEAGGAGVGQLARLSTALSG
ncbi:polysaccharide pyruvyl transferase family protein [Kineococcus sp. GCM10028916]|uniref:polysaccharide pyruvyl transferase family protein n=1 Tax=Kineococcus sp. GCM10028916 TaxID=3273394 RepID=UPI0036399451